MASLDGFNAAEVEPNAGFDVLPPGDYEAVIVASEMKQTSNGNGQYLKLELQIVGGEYQNRKLWDNLNLHSSGPNKDTTEKIAKGTLSSICRAVNVLTPKDSSELHMKVMRVTVGVKKREDTGEMQNVVKAYKPRNGAPQVPVTATASVGSSSAAATKVPW